ncbi:MAG: glycosyltransferase family 4 protein [Bacteroidales bacterium]|nr:glycosyltransferase family 4 protein [Bacteroidales bacterium]
MKKKSILFFLKVPPPYTGAAIMNKRINDSTYLNEAFNLSKINISYSQSVEALGKIQFRKLIIFLKIIFRLLKSLRFDHDLVYMQVSCTGLTFMRDSFFIFLMRLRRRKVVAHIRIQGFHKMLGSKPMLLKLYQRVFKNLEVICLSKHLANDFTIIKPKKIYVVNNGIPILDISKYNKRTKTNRLNILFFSNLIYSKGIIDFLETIKIISKENENIYGIIIGNEAELNRTELNMQIQEMDISNYIDYLGPKFDDDKNEILASTDIFVFPTHYDAFPGVLLEAMQFALPIITTKVGAIPEIVDNEVSGLIVEKQRPDLLAEKLQYLIDNNTRRIELGQNARQKFLNCYTIEKMEQNLEEVFVSSMSN